jgi:hypothetical protein
LEVGEVVVRSGGMVGVVAVEWDRDVAMFALFVDAGGVEK